MVIKSSMGQPRTSFVLKIFWLCELPFWMLSDLQCNVRVPNMTVLLRNKGVHRRGGHGQLQLGLCKKIKGYDLVVQYMQHFNIKNLCCVGNPSILILSKTITKLPSSGEPRPQILNLEPSYTALLLSLLYCSARQTSTRSERTKGGIRSSSVRKDNPGVTTTPQRKGRHFKHMYSPSSKYNQKTGRDASGKDFCTILPSRHPQHTVYQLHPSNCSDPFRRVEQMAAQNQGGLAKQVLL